MLSSQSYLQLIVTIKINTCKISLSLQLVLKLYADHAQNHVICGPHHQSGIYHTFL